MSLLGFARLVSDAGVGYALVQREAVEEHHIRASHAYCLVQSGVAGAALMALSYPLAAWLRQPHLAPLVFVSALSLPSEGWGATSQSLLRRDLRHREAQWINFGGFVVGQICVALPLSYRGLGVWSLVLGLLAGAAASSAMLWLKTRHPIRPHWHRDHLTKKFTRSILVQDLSNWILINLDTICLGRVVALQTLGYYNRGKWILETPIGYLVPPIENVTLTASARAQRDFRRVKTILVKCILLSVAVAFPFCLVGFLFPSQIVALVLGPRFATSAVVLRIFAVERIFYAVLAPVGNTLTGVGSPDYEAKVMLSITPFAVVGFFAAAQHGIIAMTYCLMCVTFTRMASQLVAAYVFFNRHSNQAEIPLRTDA